LKIEQEHSVFIKI